MMTKEQDELSPYDDACRIYDERNMELWRAINSWQASGVRTPEATRYHIDAITRQGDAATDAWQAVVRHDPESSSRRVFAHAVAVYLVTQQYGGPEEGGWYYNAGERMDEFALFARSFSTRGAARVYADQLQVILDASENEGEPPLHSVNSCGRYQAHMFDNFAPPVFPTERPVYS